MIRDPERGAFRNTFQALLKTLRPERTEIIWHEGHALPRIEWNGHQLTTPPGGPRESLDRTGTTDVQVNVVQMIPGLEPVDGTVLASLTLASVSGACLIDNARISPVLARLIGVYLRAHEHAALGTGTARRPHHERPQLSVRCADRAMNPSLHLHLTPIPDSDDLLVSRQDWPTGTVSSARLNPAMRARLARSMDDVLDWERQHTPAYRARCAELSDLLTERQDLTRQAGLILRVQFHPQNVRISSTLTTSGIVTSAFASPFDGHLSRPAAPGQQRAARVTGTTIDPGPNGGANLLYRQGQRDTRLHLHRELCLPLAAMLTGWRSGESHELRFETPHLAPRSFLGSQDSVARHALTFAGTPGQAGQPHHVSLQLDEYYSREQARTLHLTLDPDLLTTLSRTLFQANRRTLTGDLP